MCDIRSKTELYDDLTLKDQADKNSFMTKMLMSSIISALSLVGNSQEGVIGSMLIAPLGQPILGLAAALITKDTKAVGRSCFFIIVGFVVMVLSGLAVGKSAEKQKPTAEMIKRFQPPDKWTFIIAVAIGVSLGLVALSGSSIAEGVGSGIAVSLLPPVVNAALTYMKKDIPDDQKRVMISNSMNIAWYNILGVLVACVVVFGLQCYVPWFTFSEKVQLPGTYKMVKTI